MGNQVHSFDFEMSAERVRCVIKKGNIGIEASCPLRGLREGEEAAGIEGTQRGKRVRGYLLHLPYESRDI